MYYILYLTKEINVTTQQFEMNHLLRLPVTEKENKFHKTIV